MMIDFAPTSTITDDDAADPYVARIHAPIAEELTIEQLEVTGSIPAELDGRYLRMGPNPIDETTDRHHWFAGEGMVHGLRIENGKALWYRNRWIRSNAVTDALGEERTPGPRRHFDVVNTNVVPFAGKTIGVVEMGSTPVEIGETLETLRYTDFDGTLTGSFAAHPHVDPKTGEMLAVCYDAMIHDAVRFVTLAPDGKVRREVTVPVSDGPFMHDFAFTDRFAIILDFPVTFSMEAAQAGYQVPYRWNPAHQARVGLLPRQGEADDVLWAPIDPCFAFHTVNAFDRPDGKVVLDLVVHDKMFWRRTSGPDSKSSAFERWIIDPTTASIERTVIDPNPQEFPRPDERRLGQPYRYAYAMALSDPFVGTGLIKHDLVAGTRQTREFGPQRHPAEFVFVPRDEEADEDEGWLIGLVVDAAARTTDLVILNADDFSGPAQASIRLPHVMPSGFHGNWIAN